MIAKSQTTLMQQKPHSLTTLPGSNATMFMSDKKPSNIAPYNNTNDPNKIGSKRSFDDFNDTVSVNIKNDTNRKKIKTDNNNNSNFPKKEKFVLNNSISMGAFQEMFGNILRHYPEPLKSHIEKTLGDLKCEGYTV